MEEPVEKFESTMTDKEKFLAHVLNVRPNIGGQDYPSLVEILCMYLLQVIGIEEDQLVYDVLPYLSALKIQTGEFGQVGAPDFMSDPEVRAKALETLEEIKKKFKSKLN